MGFRTAAHSMRTNAAERKIEIDGALERVKNVAEKSGEIVKTLGANQEALSAQQTHIITSQSESSKKIADLEERQKQYKDEIKNHKGEMEKLKNKLASLVDNQKNDQGNVQTTVEVRLLTIYTVYDILQ